MANDDLSGWDVAPPDGLTPAPSHAPVEDAFITCHAPLQAMVRQFDHAATRSCAPVLLIGPPGVGKSLLARRLYDLKAARGQLRGPFVEGHCAAAPGAVADCTGLLVAAHQGLLFLDEIGDLAPEAQAVLLRAIDARRLQSMGADSEGGCDVLLVAASQRDLQADVALGRFRADLLARISLWTYELPGLAQRRGDIAPHVDRLLALHSAEGGHAVRLHPAARTLYLAFATTDEALWSGNFRDLQASITRLATLAEGAMIDEPCVHAEIERLRRLWHGTAGPHAPTAAEQLLGPQRFAELDLFEQVQLDAVLKVCGTCGTVSDAGRRLFQVTRRRRSVVNDADRLRKYLQRYGLSWQAVRSERR